MLTIQKRQLVLSITDFLFSYLTFHSECPFIPYSVYVPLFLWGPIPMLFLSLSILWNLNKEAIFFSSDLLQHHIPLMLLAPPKIYEARWWQEEKQMVTENSRHEASPYVIWAAESQAEDSQACMAEASRAGFIFQSLDMHIHDKSSSPELVSLSKSLFHATKMA